METTLTPDPSVTPLSSLKGTLVDFVKFFHMGLCLLSVQACILKPIRRASSAARGEQCCTLLHSEDSPYSVYSY